MTDPLEQEIVPGGRRLVVGRGAGVDAHLSHPSVFAEHARVYQSDGALWVAPIQGPTLRNGRRIDGPTRMAKGDRVQFGDLVFVVSGDRLSRRRDSAFTLECEGVVVVQDGKRTLDCVSVSVKPGEFVALLGPSGAGKSTLLRVLVGYQAAAEGRARAGAYELPAQAPWLWAGAGYVGQDDVVFPTLTAAEHLDYAIRLREPGRPAAARMEAVARGLAQVGMQDYADMRVGNMSGGQRKRVAVAQELVTGPEVLFLDEPTSGLDPANESNLVLELKKIADSGITVICATHVMGSVNEFRRAIMLIDGRVAYDGPPSGLLGHFDATNYPQLFDPARLARSTPPAPPGPARAAVPASSPPAPVGAWRQAAALAERGLKLLARDHWWALMMLLQPVIIGLVINLSQCQPARILAIPTFAAVAAVWMGLNNTARELVRERRQYARERLVGVTPLGYLVAKVVLFAGVGAAQLVILMAVLWRLNFLDFYRRDDLMAYHKGAVFSALFLAYLGASLVGLTVSALAKTQEWAVAALPILVLPQLLLTGEASGLHDRSQFQSAVHLLDRYRAPGSVPMSELAVEGASLLTFTRPSVALFKPPAESRADASATAVNLTHLFLLVALSAAALVAVFRRQEQSWIAGGASRLP